MALPTIEDLHYLLGQIDGKIVLLIEQGRIQDNRHAKLEERLDGMFETLEKRVRNVEQRQHWYAGAVAIGVAVISYMAEHWNIKI